MSNKTFASLLLLFLPLISAAETPSYTGDKDDPTSISTFAGIRAGTNGYGAIFQLGVNPEGSDFAHNSFLQLKDDFYTAHLRHFSLYKKTGTGLFIDAQHDNSLRNDDGRSQSLPDFDRNRVSAGIIQVIPIGDNLRINPALLYGKTWTSDDNISKKGYPDTDIATLYTFVRWQITDAWFLNLVPQYTYSVNDDELKIRKFEMVFQLGYGISTDTSVAFNANEDDEFWITIKHSL